MPAAKKTIMTKQLWKCPKCGREFARKGQSHSCRTFPLDRHFAGKDSSRRLYEKFKAAVKKEVGAFKIESLECCIHLVRTFTFAAVKIMKDRIRIDFSLSHIIKSKRLKKPVPMSTHRFLYFVDITDESEIDRELLQWVREALEKDSENRPVAVKNSSG